jgi:centromere/kinetochore protein ZW10
MNTVLEEPSIHDRLTKLQKAVRKATEDALKQAGANSPQPAALADNNASFMLGMDLFGQETSVLERGVRDKLVEMESELENLVERVHNNNNNDENTPWQTPQADEQQEEEDPIKRDPQHYQEQAQSLQQRILFLKECSLARSQLDDSTTLSSAALSTEPDWVQASERLVQAGQSLKQAQSILEESTEPGAPALQAGFQILDSIRNGIRRQRVDLLTKATTLLDSSISITSSSFMVKNASQLEQAYQVLEQLGQDGHSALKDSMRTLVQTLMKDVFGPVLETYKNKTASRKSWHISEKEERPTTGLIGVSTSKGPVHHLQWHREDDGSQIAKDGMEVIESWKVTLDWIVRTLSFVQSRVLLEREALCEMVGQRLFGKPDALPSNLKLDALGLESSLLGGDKGLLMEALVELMSKTCIPNYLESSQLSELAPMGKALMSYCFPFCKELVAKKLIPFDPTKPPRLVHFCQNFERNYVDNRRCVVLNEARDVLIRNDYHNTVVVGVEVAKKDVALMGVDDGMSVFQLHKSSISETSYKIMTLVRKTMDEAVTQTSHEEESPLSLLAPTLYRTAREILSLFRAIIPASHGSEVAHVPRTAAVLHNDCVYLAHNCLTLGLEYKEQFPEAKDARGKLLEQTCIFVDMVPLFRELADRAMGDMLDMQKHQIAEIAGTRITLLGKALASDESLHEWSEAETALAAGIYHLRHLSQAWKPILSTQVFGRSMGYLADAIFTLYLNQVHQATDISSSACHFCRALFAKATDEIGRLMDGNTEGSQVWEHFDAVGKIMDMHLSDIQTALANGVFRQVGAQELSRLILATFDESPKRRALLNTLANV